MNSTIFETILSNPLLVLFGLIGLGLLLGNLQFRGINLGSSGVIFVALLAGHLGMKVPAGVGQIGLVLFVYSVGIGAGARFFGAMKREGSQLAKLAVLVVGSGALTALLAAWIFHIEPGLIAGIFAGALTSTPALAAAIEGAGQGAAGPVVVGYGIAYPFGVIGVVLFVQLLPKLLGKRLEDEAGEEETAPTPTVTRRLIEVTNPNLFGQRFAESKLPQLGACLVSRVWRNERLEPVTYEDTFEPGQLLLLVGEPSALELATEFVGRASDRKVVLDADNERQVMVVTSQDVVGKSLKEIDPLRNHGVVITRMSRLEFTLVPQLDTRLEKGDFITVVGSENRLKKFAKIVGHHANAYTETSLVSLAIGIALGIVLGLITVPLPWGGTFSLGLSGGPLMVALLLGHFGKVGGILGYIPRPTRLLLQEMGLVLFLADAGTKGGATMAEAIASQGAIIFVIGAVVTLVPMLFGFLAARKIFRMPLPQALGGICGGMTSTPALGTIVAKTPLQAPIVSYATVYPVAVILMALLAKLLMQAVGML
ncbi:MAG: TrkA C-terminal domain-containing protein [Verrucomicrobiota bacterium JB022]|nr:TrkA C-terminal domain-containing protein [Verrucomicrobiota bacterium JB022]